MATTINTSTDDSVNYLDVEEAARESLSVHWRAVFAGVFIAMLVYFTLASLGMAFGAGQVQDVLRGQDSARALGTGVGIWMIVTVLISLAVGSYASARVSGIIATRIGYTQGAVIAAIFFTLMLTQAGMALGAVGSGLGALKDALGGAVSTTTGNSQMSNILEDAMGDLDLRSPPETVAAGVLSRLMRGDQNAAIGYLANQAGITQDDAEARFQTLNAQIRNASAQLAQRTADAARAVGWVAFGMMLVGSLFAMLGGGLGAQLNIRKPIDRLDQRALRTQQRPAFT